jgi:hypothetical protein
MGEWTYISMHSLPRHYMELNIQLHAPFNLSPGKEPPITRAGLDAVAKREISCPCRESKRKHIT